MKQDKSGDHGPPEHEWLFGDRRSLNDAETEAAYYWEFALETPAVVVEVEADRQKQRRYEQRDAPAFRKWMRENPRPEDFSQWGDWAKKCHTANPDSDLTTRLVDNNAHFLCHWPEFPQLHWLQMPQETRQEVKRIRPIAGHGDWRRERSKPDYWSKQMEAREFGTAPSFFYKTKLGIACHTWISDWQLQDESNVEWWRDWADTIKSPWGFGSADRWDEYRLVEVNWARSDRKLRADFAKWLKENRPDDRQPFHRSKESDSRRTTHRDLLKALGASRLLRHFKFDWKTAAAFSALFCQDKLGGPKPLYSEQSEWADARTRTEEALRDFEAKVFG